MRIKEDKPTVLLMSSYPPRKCGIATFTRDLIVSIDSSVPEFETKILALTEPDEKYEYSEKVTYKLKSHSYEDYLKVADQINFQDFLKGVCIQHEFGLFGGEQSCHPLPFLDKIRKPVIINFHSVFPKPQEEVKQLIKAISKRVSRIIVMTEKAVEILKKDYAITTPISIIPHGIPNVRFESQNFYKQKFGLSGRKIVSSFGLLGPGKGYEYTIKSLPKVVKNFPETLFLILGATHPSVIEEEGETYRNYLKKLVKDNALENNVVFVDRYLSLKELVTYLKATDIYVSSSQNPEQITSGTLAYAVGCGRAVVATPFPHALDLIKSDNGFIVDFENTDAYSNAFIKLFSNPEKLEQIEKSNYEKTRHMTWENVARAYSKTISDLLSPQFSVITRQTKL